MIIILTGVSGSGKTTVGKLLAQQLNCMFVDADDFHSAANIQKMAAGKPLTDDERWPWLDDLRQRILQFLEQDLTAVVACSALKQAYRERLNPDPEQVRFVRLQGNYELIHQRLKERHDHFMSEQNLHSQFADLQPSKQELVVNVSDPPAVLVAKIARRLALGEHLQAEVLVEGLMFPEAPRWHQDRLWFTDQHAKQVLQMKPDGSLSLFASTPDLPGGLGWLPDGTLLVVFMTQRKVYQFSKQQWQEYADLSQLATFHCNDMVVDDIGRAWIGNFGYDLHGGENIKPASLVLVKREETPQAVSDDLIFPNGCAITNDKSTLIVAETFASRITAFDLDPQGHLSRARVWAELGGAYPDGLCLDQQANVWVATPNTGEVMHLSKSGQVLARVKTKGRPYACMLGGPQGNTLYIATSETDDPQEAVSGRSGRIEACETQSKHMGYP